MEPPEKGKRIRSFHERVPTSEERDKRASVILSLRMDSPTAPGSELKDFLNALLLEDKSPDAQQSYKFYCAAPSSALNILSHLPKARLAPTREDDSPVWVFPDGANESEAETLLANHVAVQSLSTYPRNMKTGKRYGSPNADYYGLGLYRNRYLSVVADGCGWGPDAAESARDSTAALLKYLEQHHTKGMLSVLLRALAQGAAAVRRGATTLLASVLAEVRQEDIPIVGSEWVFICVSIGDCKALIYQPTTGRLRDVTAGNRAGSNSPVDPGGSLAADSHDLRNLGCYYGTCNKDDIVVMVSDGVHDNFDPQQLGFTPQELKLDIEDWETKALTDAVDKVRTKFRLAVMGQKLVGATNPETITQVLIQHCIETTRRSRNWMEQHPNQRLPKDYRAFPGKQDHTSCLSIRVSKVAIDDQLQFKIDEKMRQLHRKEMQAQVAAKYEEAARTRQVLNSALFSRSLNVRPTTTVAKPAPRLQDVRQSTFTQLGSPAPAIIKTQKSRSLVDVRPRSQSGEVHPSWAGDPVRASPPRLERVKVPPLRTEMIRGQPKPQMAQGSGLNVVPTSRALQRPDPAYLSRSDGLVQTDSQGVIRSASIPRIVEQLVLWFRGPDTPAIVAEQRDCFLLCYKLYCTPRQLLDIIRSLYTRQKPSEVSEDAWRKHTSQLRTGLADLISRWLAVGYAVDFWSDDGTINYILYEQLMETIEMFPDEKSPTASPSKRLKDQLPKLPMEMPSPKHEKDKKKQKETSSSKGALRATLTELISKRLPRPEEIKFVDLNVSDISEHLTFIDYELFSRVTRQEVLGYSTTRPMSAIRSWQHRGELVRRWVATEFIITVNAKQRSVVLDRFARIAERCFEFGNYHCCQEILNGLDHPAIQKLLVHHRISVSPVVKQLQKAMEGYQETLNERMRSGKYAIPSLSFYLRRMDELAKVPPTDPERPDNLLFEKMHGLGRILTEIIALQGLPFSKVEDESPNDKAIKMYLMTLDARVRLDRELDVAARQEEANAIN